MPIFLQIYFGHYWVGIPLALITVKVIKDYSKVEPYLVDMKNEADIVPAKPDLQESDSQG